MKSILKNQKGFTLIEVLVVVIIVAILAAIAVPIYLRYVEKARSSEPQAAISAIRNAYSVYRQTFGTTDSYSVEDALKDAQLGDGTEKSWTFEVVGNPPKKFIATSTAEYPAGEGLQVIYDENEDRFTGYGLTQYSDEEEEE